MTKIFQCLDDELISQALKIMNCSPPYLTNKKQFWCNEDIERTDSVLRFLWKLGGGILDDGKCFPPCQKTKYERIFSPNFSVYKTHINKRYEIIERGFDGNSETYGMKIYFINDVQVTRSHLTIEPLTLMSRIGGIIGVGQALAWIILLCYDKIIILNTHLINNGN